MIFHASIPADEPEHVAGVLAELMGGAVAPFKGWPDSFVALTLDEHNSFIEVYPRALVMEPGEGEEGVAPGHDSDPARRCCTHMAIGTPLSGDEVMALAKREGWRAVRCNRGGIFDVIEFWVENSLMIEALTPEMQADYLARRSPRYAEAKPVAQARA